MTGKHYLSDMDLDEISSVLKGDNHGADILIVKNMPGAQDVHHEDTLDSKDFKKGKKKRLSRMREDAYEAIEKMTDESDDKPNNRRLR